MQEFEATFKLERETKNTHRYQEEVTGTAPKIGSLYIQKWATGSPPPNKVKVKVTQLAP